VNSKYQYPWEEDIQTAQIAFSLFNNSRFRDAEKLLQPKYNSHLYHTVGSAVLQFMKALLTFEPADLSIAMQQLDDTIFLASQFRSGHFNPAELKKTRAQSASVMGTVWGAISSLVKGRLGVENLEYHELHAELVYAEANMLKSLLSIMSDQSGFVNVVKEAWNIRNTYYTYKEFGDWISKMDEQVEHDSGVSKESENSGQVDEHIRSGVLFGIGMFNLTLSFLPSKVMKLIEFVGFSGNRSWALNQFQRIGGWEKQFGHSDDLGDFGYVEHMKSSGSSSSDNSQSPVYSAITNEVTGQILIPAGGLRRPLCDYALLMYHTLISSFIELPDVNLVLASHMLNVLRKCYPNGFLMHYFTARVFQQQRQLKESIETYEKSIQVQQEWRQFHHVCYWELGNSEASNLNFCKAADYFRILCKESNWSKSVYYYLCASYLLQHGQKKDHLEATKLLEEVPNLRRKVAGKSIPIEVR
jgi:tetratricopeptide (TPR) repeat protein